MPAHTGSIARTERPVVVRRWEERSVVFDLCSGDTLFFDEPGSLVFDLVESGRSSLDAIVPLLEAQFEIDRQQASDLATAALDELQRLGLVTREPG